MRRSGGGRGGGRGGGEGRGEEGEERRKEKERLPSSSSLKMSSRQAEGEANVLFGEGREREEETARKDMGWIRCSGWGGRED